MKQIKRFFANLFGKEIAEENKPRLDLVDYKSRFKSNEKMNEQIREAMPTPAFADVKYIPDLDDYNMSALSDYTKELIIILIKEDEQKRVSENDIFHTNSHQ